MLNFDPNLIIPVLTGEQLFKYCSGGGDDDGGDDGTLRKSGIPAQRLRECRLRRAGLCSPSPASASSS